MSLVLKSLSPLRAPLPDHPRMPDLVTGLGIHLRAADIVAANGEDVTTIIAGGSWSARDRTFNGKRADSVWPKLATGGGPNGGKALVFNGTSMIANTDGATFPAVRNQPITYALVAKIDTYPTSAAHGNRMLTGVTTDLGASFQTIQPTQNNNISVAAESDGSGSPQDYAYFVPGTNWFVLVWSLNGAQSKGTIDGTVIDLPNMGGGQYKGLTLGGRFGFASNDLLRGRYAELMVFERALSASDMAALHLSLSRTYGLG